MKAFEGESAQQRLWTAIRNMSNSRTARTDRLAAKLKALSNPHRLRMLLRLAECCRPGSSCCNEDEIGPCVGEVAKGAKVAPSTISHHMKELRAAGLIRMERRGQRIECSVDPASLKDLSRFFSELASEDDPAQEGKDAARCRR